MVERVKVHSIEDCLHKARHGVKERVDLLREKGLPIPPKTADPRKWSLRIFMFRLSEREGRMLKALAELEGVSVPEIVGREVSEIVRTQMAIIARRFMEDRQDAPLGE